MSIESIKPVPVHSSRRKGLFIVRSLSLSRWLCSLTWLFRLLRFHV